MMSKGKYYVLLTVFGIMIITLGFNSYVTFSGTNSNNFLSENKETSVFSKDSIEKLYFTEVISQNIENNGLGTKILFDYNGNTLFTSKGSKIDLSLPILILRYSFFGCNICTEFATDKLKEHFNDYETNPQVLFIASDYNVNMDMGYKNLINIGNKNLGLPIERSNTPFFFILNGDKVENTFMPERKFPQYTDVYLKKIKRRYFSK